MVSFDERRAPSVTPLDRVRKAIVDARVDLELPYPARRELALDRADERPNQTLSPVQRIDEHVEEACATVGPRRSRDSETDERRAMPGRTDHSVGVCRLPPHLALGKCTRTPLLPLELQHARAELTPGGGIEDDDPDRWRHEVRSAPGDPDDAGVACEIANEARFSPERVLE